MENMFLDEKDSVKDFCQDFKYMFQKLIDKVVGIMYYDNGKKL